MLWRGLAPLWRGLPTTSLGRPKVSRGAAQQNCCSRLLLVIGVAMTLGASPARGESWIFQPSYYSHDPATQVRIGPAPRNGPYYTRPFGAAVNAGYRHLNSSIRVGGQTSDHVHLFESWVQFREQF